MITPSYKLNWATGLSNAAVDVTRAGDATYTDSDGLIKSANINTQRVDWSTGEPGILIEESRANAAINSIFAGATATPTSWIRLLGTDGASVVSTLSPSLVSAWRFEAATNRQVIYQVMTVSANTTYAFSVYVESNPNNTPATQIIAITNTPAGSTVNTPVSEINPLNGKARIRGTVTIGATAGTLQFRIGIGTSSNRTGVIVISCPQFELGNSVTSFIPTAGSSVTRNADVATVTGANFSNFWQATRGGITVNARPSSVSGIRPWVQIDDNTANNLIALRGNTTNPELYIVDGSAPQVQLDAGTIAANIDYSLTGWWNTNDCKARLDANPVVSDTTASIPTVTQIRIGSDGTNYLNGHIQSISYYKNFSGQIYTRRKNKVICTIL